MIIKKIFEDYEIRIESDASFEELALIQILYVGDHGTASEIHSYYAEGSIEELLSEAIDLFIYNVVLTDQWKTKFGSFE